MARAHSLLKDWLAGSRRSEPAARPIARRPVAAVEALEGRRLLSATVVNPGGPVTISPPPVPITPVPVAARGYGVALKLKAGQRFDNYLGVLIGAKVPAGDKVGASINWGDGTLPSAGVVFVTKVGHIDVGGAHAYAAAGNYAVTITVTAAPVPVPGQPTPLFVIALGTINSRAVVSAANSNGGVTIHETAGAAFTTTVGTFSAIAPATGFQAGINWGDGTASVGTITSTGVSGVDVINFKVDGSHTYAKAGTFPIVVTVTQRVGPPGSLTPIRLVATIDSSAVVAPRAGINLDGMITGRALPAPTAVDVGAYYLLTGSGTAGVMGPVTAAGHVQLPGLIVTGHATGTLTLTRAATTAAAGGSVTLTLTGPPEEGFGPFPSVLDYVVTGGTGAFTNASGTGTIDSALGTTSGLTFTFVINSA